MKLLRAGSMYMEAFLLQFHPASKWTNSTKSVQGRKTSQHQSVSKCVFHPLGFKPLSCRKFHHFNVRTHPPPGGVMERKRFPACFAWRKWPLRWMDFLYGCHALRWVPMSSKEISVFFIRDAWIDNILYYCITSVSLGNWVDSNFPTSRFWERIPGNVH